ncbi:putative protein binding protein [Hibiscus syriacus]|uniref:Uncharacterized protein n=1 Tax=Hibiscus syriacus TaxID=106335 RepID=A0A6A2ZRT8_HIBSY|nr:putative protein binding protein [Hibiscus syriacus]
MQDMNRSSEKTCLSVVTDEFKCIPNTAFPMVLTGVLLYCRSMISMLFLGRLGELALAGGSLAIRFANITGYWVLSGLSMEMEPICGQAFGAKRYKILGLTMRKMILFLLLTSTAIAALYLVAQSVLHPLRAYLRAQSITLPLTCCSTLAILLHIPINYLLVTVLNLGIKGVTLGSVWININLVDSLIVYLKISGVYKKTWDGISSECLKGWKYLLDLSFPSCISVCLEWWWYEIMILLCGLLLNPQATIASMGILIQKTSLIYIFPSSLSFGVSIRVGNELGANNPNKAKLALIIGLSSSSVLGLSALIFAILVQKKWATMFTKDPEIIALTSMVLPILGLCELGNCPQTTGCGVLRWTAKPKLIAISKHQPQCG